MQTFIAAVSLALVVSFVCSIFESVLLSIGAAQVESLADDHARAGALMKRFKQRIDVPIAAILIVNTIAHTIGASVAGASYENVFDPSTLWIFTIVFTAAVLLLTEIVPKTLGVTHARRLAPAVAFGIQALIVLLRPLVWGIERVSRMLRGDRVVPVTSAEEIRLLAMLGRREGAVGPRTAGIIVGATRLGELRAIDVMLPRHEVIFLSAELPRRELLGVLRESRHSRFPFSRTAAFDHVEGIVLAKELLLQVEADPAGEIDWSALIREPLVVPESQPLNVLLRAFQEARMHMALVVDEYGQIQGIVTIEDVLEEMVGEIVDESDALEPTLAAEPDGSLRVKSTADLRQLCARLDIAWDPRGAAHSINGLVTERLGRLPRVGDRLDWHGYEIEVLAATERRAELVSIRKKRATKSNSE